MRKIGLGTAAVLAITIAWPAHAQLPGVPLPPLPTPPIRCRRPASRIRPSFRTSRRPRCPCPCRPSRFPYRSRLRRAAARSPRRAAAPHPRPRRAVAAVARAVGGEWTFECGWRVRECGRRLREQGRWPGDRARRRRAGGLGHESGRRGRCNDAGAEARDRAHRSARAEGRHQVRGLPRGPACSPAPGAAPARGDRAAAPGVAGCGRPAAGPRGGAGAPRGAAGRPGASARGPRGLRGRVRPRSDDDRPDRGGRRGHDAARDRRRRVLRGSRGRRRRGRRRRLRHGRRRRRIRGRARTRAGSAADPAA